MDQKGYISVISTKVRLVQKKSSRQATLGWARRDSKSLSWKDLVRVLLRRGRNLAANTSPVRLWTTRFTTPKVPLKLKEMMFITLNLNSARGKIGLPHLEYRLTFLFPHGHHIRKITSFSSPAPPLSLETPVDLQRKPNLRLKQVHHNVNHIDVILSRALGLCSKIEERNVFLWSHLPPLSAQPGTRRGQSRCRQSRCICRFPPPRGTLWLRSSVLRAVISPHCHWLQALLHPSIRQDMVSF